MSRYPTFGAIAFSATTKVRSYSYGMANPYLADQAALQICNRPDCRVVSRIGSGECAVLATTRAPFLYPRPLGFNPLKEWGFETFVGGLHNLGWTAEQAVSGCQMRHGRPCHVHAYVCTG